jgi:hypothetical protein
MCFIQMNEQNVNPFILLFAVHLTYVSHSW